MRRKGPKWTLREHWRTFLVFMLVLAAIVVLPLPTWAYIALLVGWAVVFNVVTRVQLRRGSADRT